MSVRVHPTQGERNPHVQLVQLVIDHLTYAERYPRRMAALGRRLRVSATAALAIAIVDHVAEEFTIIPREHP